MTNRALCTLLVAACVAGCGEGEAGTWAMRPIGHEYTFPARDAEGAVVPGGRTVSAADLDEGRMAYLAFCASCHGLEGDGRGPDAAGMDPPPRDFRTGMFKFAAVRSGELPNDDDLHRLIQGGLAGTEMPPWGLDDGEIAKIADFLKTFPPSWCGPRPEVRHTLPETVGPCEESGPWVAVTARGKRVRQTGKPVRGGVDPWADRDQEAIARGEVLYHLQLQCVTCHPSYLDAERLGVLSIKALSMPFRGGRANPEKAVPLAADKNVYADVIVPPDFKKDVLRSVRPGHETEDLHRVIAAGVGGVMPAWVDASPPEDLWAIAHYLRALQEHRR